MRFKGSLSIPLAMVCLSLLASDPAHAFRCGSRLVTDGMHESEVIAICGEPVSERTIGYVVRSYFRRGGGYSGYAHEVLVTELVYNFGPRKFMRRLRFEGGILRSMETMGYGYHKKRD